LAEHNCLIAGRRPRSEKEKPVWIMNTVVLEGEGVGSLQYETDRMQFIGRGRNVSEPVALEPHRPLTNSVGAVLDPVMSFRQIVRVEPGKSVKISFVTAVANSREDVVEMATKLKARR